MHPTGIKRSGIYRIVGALAGVLVLAGVFNPLAAQAAPVAAPAPAPIAAPAPTPIAAPIAAAGVFSCIFKSACLPVGLSPDEACRALDNEPSGIDWFLATSLACVAGRDF